jgi:hypothetical protein
MKVYCMEFAVESNSVYPGNAIEFNSLKELKEEYSEFLDECSKFGQDPSPVFVYIGIPAGNEKDLGYPNYPDYIIEQGSHFNPVLKRV